MNDSWAPEPDKSPRLRSWRATTRSTIMVNDDAHTASGYVITKYGIVVASTHYCEKDGWLTQVRMVCGGVEYLREWCRDFTNRGMARIAVSFAKEMAATHSQVP